MFCIYCGYSVIENARFCPKCGRALPILSEEEMGMMPEDGPGPLTENIKEQIYKTCYTEVYRQNRILTADEKLARASVKTAFDKVFKSSSVERNEALIVTQLKEEARTNLKSRLLARNPFLFSADPEETSAAPAPKYEEAGEYQGNVTSKLGAEAVSKQLDYFLKGLTDRERYAIGLASLDHMSDEAIGQEMAISAEEASEARISAGNKIAIAFTELKRIGVITEDVGALPYFRNLIREWNGDATEWESRMVEEFEAGADPMALSRASRLRPARLEEEDEKEEDEEDEDEEEDEREKIKEKKKKKSSRNNALLALVILIVAIVAVSAVIFVPRLLRSSESKEPVAEETKGPDTQSILKSYQAKLTYLNGRYQGYFRKDASTAGLTYVCGTDFPGGNIASSIEDFDGDGEYELIILSADADQAKMTATLVEVEDEKAVVTDERELDISAVPEAEKGYVSLDVINISGTPAISVAELASSSFFEGRDVVDVRFIAARNGKLLLPVNDRAVNDSDCRIIELRKQMTAAGIASSVDFDMTCEDWQKMISSAAHLAEITSEPGDYVEAEEWYTSARMSDLYAGVITFNK